MSEIDISRMTADPVAFFAPFTSIVLVANSRDATNALSDPSLGERPLFAFFNRVYRILDDRFDRDCLLISRSYPVGASLVYRKELDDVLSLVKGRNFHGILNVRGREKEKLSPLEDFKGNPVGYLDLTGWADRLYPRGARMPSTGFAVAVWLAQKRLPVPIYLAGFTGVREDRWRIFDAHDWTWEQIVLNLMFKKGMIGNLQTGKYFDHWPFEALAAEFPDITEREMSTTAIEVLSHRLGGTNRVIDHIYSSLKIQLAVRDFFRRIRPESRKARTRKRLLAEMQKRQEAA